MGFWGRVQVVVLNRVVRVSLIEKVTFGQRGKEINYRASCGRQRYSLARSRKREMTVEGVRNG